MFLYVLLRFLLYLLPLANKDKDAVFVYATHATQAIAFEWKPDFIRIASLDSKARPSSLQLCVIPL